MVWTHSEMTIIDLIAIVLAVLLVWYSGKIAGKLQERSNQRKRWAQRVRLRITPWHLGQLTIVYLRPNEALHLATCLIDHLLSEKDEYAR